MAFLYEYGLFLAKTLTWLVAIGVVLALIANSRQRRGGDTELEITDLSKRWHQQRDQLRAKLLPAKQLKALHKQEAKAEKQASKQEERKRTLFVLDFKGSMDAHEVSGLRDEINAVLTIADPEQDEVLVRLESGGGVVHGYGLGASQLERLRHANLPLTVAIDKVAASGGYLMAVVANRILCAPFAYIGSIGVIAQLPNFNKVLKKHDIDFEQHTAGDYKRTLTLFGENSDEGRAKFREELALIHRQFKAHVLRLRPQLAIDSVATGEVWSGVEAHQRGLVDDLLTSDELLQGRLDSDEWQVLQLSRKVQQPLLQRLLKGSGAAVAMLLRRLAA